MTLICTSGHRTRSNNGGLGSPNRCTSPIDIISLDCSTRTTNSTRNNRDLCSTDSKTSVLFGGSSPHTKSYVETMSRIEISFSSSSLESGEAFSPPPLCHVPPDSKQGRSASVSCSSEGDRAKLRNKIIGGLPRSILKKSKSADSATIADLRETLLESRCLSISLSDPSFTIEACDDEDGPKSPNKNVTFADDNNLSLVKIHNFVPSNDKLDQWQFSVFQTQFNCQRLSGNQAMAPQRGNRRVVRKPNQLLVCFKEPCDNPDFMEHFRYKCVALERCATRDRSVTGIVLVKNIEFHKQVTIRYTLDCWKTSNDVEACYLSNSNDGESDRFSFTLALPRSYKEMEFAVCYKTGSAEYWDNNFNRNYKVKDALTPF